MNTARDDMLEKKIERFLDDLGDDFYVNKMIVRMSDINKDEYEAYLKTGYKHMYFEDYYRIGDGVESLIEERDEELIDFILENY